MKPEEKISRFLTFGETFKSATAKRLGIDNTPGPELLDELKATASNVYDKVVDHFGKDYVHINSFFRCHQLNVAIGGAVGSQHEKAEAIDIDSPENKRNIEIFEFVKTIVFDQLIFEYPDEHGVPDWIHCSFVSHPKKNRGQILVKLKAKYVPYGEWKPGMT